MLVDTHVITGSRFTTGGGVQPLKPFSFATSYVVFLSNARNHRNEPVNGAPNMTSTLSPTEYAQAVVRASRDAFITNLWEAADRRRHFSVTYIPHSWNAHLAPDDVLTHDLARFLPRAKIYERYFSKLELEMQQVVKILQNVVVVVPEKGIKQYDPKGAMDRGGCFVEARRLWARHTIEMGDDDYSTLRHELWHYLDALLGIHSRPFFQKLIDYVALEGPDVGKRSDGPLAQHILSIMRHSNGKPLYTLDQVPKEAGARGYEFWTRTKNGDIAMYVDAMDLGSLDIVNRYHATAMYVQEVAMPAAKTLAEMVEKEKEKPRYSPAKINACITHVRDLVLPQLERDFVRAHPIIDGKESMKMLSFEQRALLEKEGEGKNPLKYRQ